MLSIIIPTYEQNGFGAGNLMQCLYSIAAQKDLQKFEVIISDNSVGDACKNVVEIVQGQLKYYGKELNLSFYKNPNKGAAANANFALDRASGELIKPLFMDDMFAAPDSLYKFKASLVFDGWCFSSSYHLDEFTQQRKPFAARMDIPMLMAGSNTIGMPSVIAFRKTDLRFDTSLATLFDVEFYLQLYKLYGPPAIIEEPLVIQRIHPHSLSSRQTPRFLDEAKRIREKLNFVSDGKI